MNDLDILPAVALPNIEQELDQLIIVPGGIKINAADFFKRIGGAKNIRLMAQTYILGAKSPPRVTWQYCPNIKCFVISVAYPAALDKTGRITYAAILAKDSEISNLDELQKKIISYPFLIPDDVLIFLRENSGKILTQINEQFSLKYLGGEYDKKKEVARSQIRNMAICAVVILIIIMLIAFGSMIL